MSGTGAPVEMVWQGGVLRPVSPYWLRRAQKEFGEGEVVRIVRHHERSMGAHNAYFAQIENAWKSLPPMMEERFPSADHLRRYALVKAGYCHSDSIVCPSHADALRVSAFVRGADEFAVVTVNKNVVTRYTPKSQSYRNMDKKTFMESKEKTLEVIADLLGVTAGELDAAKEVA